MATTLFPDGGLRLQDGTQRPMLLPSGVTAPTNPAHIVSFELSSGEVLTVGSVSELLRLAHAMRAEGLYSIMPTEDLFIVLAGAAKLLICESSFQNQKLLNSAAPAYTQGRLEFLMRCSAQVMSLDEALASVGHYRTASAPYASNYDLQQPVGPHRPRITVVDYKYSQLAGVSGEGTQLADGTPFAFAP